MDHQSPETRIVKDLPGQYAEEPVIRPVPGAYGIAGMPCRVEVVHLRGRLANLPTRMRVRLRGARMPVRQQIRRWVQA